MVIFEKQEKEFVTAEDLRDAKVGEIKIISEIQNKQTPAGRIKPHGMIEYKQGLATLQKEMRFNNKMMNHLIDISNSDDSNKWIGMSVKVKTETILGNLAIVPA